MGSVISNDTPLRRVTTDEYRRLFPTAPTAFDSVDFALLNQDKADDVAFLVGHGMGIIVGLRQGVWRAPFSSPYSLPSGEGDAGMFFKELNEFAHGKLSLVLPSEIYGGNEWHDAVADSGGVLLDEFNYHYPLEQFEQFLDYASGPVPRNLRRASKAGFTLRRTDDIPLIYRFIAEHHRRLNYHMAMTEEQVRQTAEVIPIDFFTLHTADNTTAAAAIIYHSAPGIVQLINWGDDTELRQHRTMNALAYSIIEHYATKHPEIRIFDLGPASTDGVKNEGLVRFKMSLGCIETTKLTLKF